MTASNREIRRQQTHELGGSKAAQSRNQPRYRGGGGSAWVEGAEIRASRILVPDFRRIRGCWTSAGPSEVSPAALPLSFNGRFLRKSGACRACTAAPACYGCGPSPRGTSHAKLRLRLPELRSPFRGVPEHERCEAGRLPAGRLRREGQAAARYRCRIDFQRVGFLSDRLPLEFLPAGCEAG